MAVNITAQTLASIVGTDETTAARLLPVASALVLRYAPGAPDSMHDEGVIRTTGWLQEHPHGAIRSESQGDISTSYATASVSALRHSGAMALLSPWKQRRGGAI